MTDAPVVEGFVEPGFEEVREAFTENFRAHGEVGAAFCLHVEGRPVVDLWGGMADPATDTPYQEDTLQLVFSTTKGATALCAHLLAQRGLLDLDAPVARYWPEFAAAGKADVPVHLLLAHQAGLPTTDRTLTLEEALAWDPVVDALAAQAPLWEPGTAHGYHALTYGWLVGEVVRRVDGRSLGRFFADEVAEPLGLEFWIGLPSSHERRVAPLIGSLAGSAARAGGGGGGREVDPAMAELMAQFLGPDSMLGRALSMSGTFADTTVFNDPAVHAAEVPAANGITNARSLSRLYAGMVGPVAGGPDQALLTPDQIEHARTVRTSGADRCLMFDTTFGLGFMCSGTFAPFGGAGSFGHPGAGGSVGFADPENQLGFGYVMNRMLLNLSGDPRTRALVAASYAAIGVAPEFV